MSFNDLPFFSSGRGPGESGKDGVSPTISVAENSSGHTLTIVDITGTKTVDIMNGVDGKDGPQGPAGPQGIQGEIGPRGEQGLQGETGAAGKDGTSAVITAVSATIDNTSGTPNVSVSLGGTTVERTFTFSFTGLKGAKGDTGEQGPQGDKGETGETGDKGDKGDDGKSAYEYAKDGGYSSTEAEFATLLANAINKQNITLGLHTDGLLYLFINNEPVGAGIELHTPQATE